MGVLRRRGCGLLIAAGLVGSSVLVAGCGSQKAAENGQLERAADVTAATGVKMNISFSERVGGPSVVFYATGSFTPKKNQGSMQMSMSTPSAGGGGTSPMPVVISHGTIYERLPSQLASRIPGGKPWLSIKLNQLTALGQLPGLNSFINASLTFDDPSQYLDFLSAAAASSVKQLGQATVNGATTTVYRTEIDISKLPTASPATSRQAASQFALMLKSRLHATQLPVDVYVDRHNLIRRLQTSVNGHYNGNAVSLSITENITRYGSQPAPSVPSSANTTSLLSLVQGFTPSAAPATTTSAGSGSK